MNTKQHQTECTGSETRDATPSVAAAGEVEVAPLRQASSVPVDVLAVMDRMAGVVLPAKLWDGNNPYCNRPGIDSQSEYAVDMAKLIAARAAVRELIEAAGVVTKKTSAGHFAFAGARELERLAAIVAKVQP